MTLGIGLVGATGRSGSFVVEALKTDNSATLQVAVVSPQSNRLGLCVGETGLCYTSNLEELVRCQGVVDFSNADTSIEAARVCARAGVPILIAATGHSNAQREELAQLSRQIPLCLAPNTSVGATILAMASELVHQLLGPSYDREVLEIHHRMKRDAPSGTALALVRGLVESEDQMVFGRSGLRQNGEVGVVSLRGGDVPGDHTVFFLGEGERLELTHRVQSRSIFGSGALVLIRKLIGRTSGMYTVRDLLLV